jgi:hypothetical protein
MAPHLLIRLTLHLLLLSSQLWPVAIVPMEAAASTSDATTVSHAMPCHGDAAAKVVAHTCRNHCCPHATCESGTCVNVAVLPTIAEAMPTAASDGMSTPGLDTRRPQRLLDTPLRPPAA